MDKSPSSDDEERLTLHILVDPPSPSSPIDRDGSSISAEIDTGKIKKESGLSESQENHTDKEASATSKTQTLDEGFSWPEYMRETKSKAAPPDCFFQDPNPPVNNFKVDMKVEVPDLRGNGTHCLATIQHVHSVWICVRLDGEDASNDHWMICDDRSILQVGANKRKGNPIQPPYGYKYNISGFHKFIENQLKPRRNGESPAAPSGIFRPISSNFHPQKNKFEVGMKCEAIDYKNFNGRPCPATIVEVEDDYVTINFDGWNSSYNLKMRYDSRYLFPVGWSAKNGLAINPPLKMQGKTKSGSIRKETNRKSLHFSKQTLRALYQKNKMGIVKQVPLKKRKCTSSAGSAPPGRKPRINYLRLSSSLHASSKKLLSDESNTASLTDEDSKRIKLEGHIPVTHVTTETHHEQSLNSEVLMKATPPLQRPVARKTIPSYPVHQVLPKHVSTISKPAQNVNGLSVQPTSPPLVSLNTMIMHPPSQLLTLSSVNPSGSQLSLIPTASSSTQSLPTTQQEQTRSGDRPTKDFHLEASKRNKWIVRKKFGDEVPENRFVSTNGPAPDIILTPNGSSLTSENSRMTVYINRYCNCAPLLDSKKIEKLPPQIGPASHYHVFRETVQQIVNCAVDSALVLKEIKPATSHVLCVTSVVNGVTHIRALPILQSSAEAWEWIHQLASKLKVCSNLLKEAQLVCQNCRSDNDASVGDSSDSGRSSHPHLSESGDSLSSGDGNSDEALTNWSIDRVASEVETMFDPIIASRFRQNQIDGQALILLSTDLLMQYLEMPFGPALKMVNFVDTLKKKYRR